MLTKAIGQKQIVDNLTKTPLGRLTMRKILAVLGLLASIVPAPGSAADLRKVAINFGLTYVPVGNSPVFSVPQAMGFWKEEGLDVQVQLANGSGTAMQQLIAGQVVGSVGGVPPAMTLINKGAPIITAASINSRNVYYPVVLETSAIKTIADMKGAKVGIVSAASSNVYWIKSMLQKHGLDPEKDITLVSVGSGPAALQALTSGRIDVLQLFEAAYDQIELSGTKLRRFDHDPDFNSLAFTFGMVVRLDTFNNDPNVLVRVLRGIAKGIVYAKAHPEDAVRMHWKVYPLAKPQGVSDEQALANDVVIIKSALKNHAWIDQKKFGYEKPESVIAIRDVLKQFGELDTALPPERYFDPKLVDKINDFDQAEVAVRKPAL
jgi:NitT/TauT family transport system substrate-binding protein